MASSDCGRINGFNLHTLAEIPLPRESRVSFVRRISVARESAPVVTCQVEPSAVTGRRKLIF